MNPRKWRLKLPQSHFKWHAGQIGAVQQTSKALFVSITIHKIIHSDYIVSIMSQDLIHQKLLTVCVCVCDFRE